MASQVTRASTQATAAFGLGASGEDLTGLGHG